MEIISAAKNLIAIDSSSSHGTQEICECIRKIAETLGLYVFCEESVQAGTIQTNIYCSKEPIEGQIDLALTSHLDTVDPGSFALWEQTGSNPYQATIRENKIYGLGAVKSKIDFLCKLFALKDCGDLAFKKRPVVIGTFDGEGGMQGTLRLLRAKKFQIDRVLVGEPTNFDVVYAGKGLANFEISIPFSVEEMDCRAHHDTMESQSTQSKIFRGRSAHSSRPESGLNALEGLLGYLSKLPDQLLVLEIDGGTNYNTIPNQAVLEFDIYPFTEMTINQKLLKIYEGIQKLKLEFEKHRDPNFSPEITTFNIGIARTMSDHLSLEGCVHWPPGVDKEVYGRWIKIIRSLCSQLNAQFRLKDFKMPFSLDPESSFCRQVCESLQKIDSKIRAHTQPVTTEANLYNHFGVEALVFGPGQRDDNAHTPNEYLSISDLEKARNMYRGLIQDICI